MLANWLMVIALSTGVQPASVPSQSAPEPDAVRCGDGNAAIDMAIRACTRLLESGRYDAKGKAAWLTNRGLHQQRARRFAESVRDFDAAIELAPDDVNLHLSRGASYGMAGELDAAIRDFEKVLALDPNSGLGYMNRATALEKKGDYVASQRDYDKAVQLIPDNWIAWDGRCWLRAIVGNDLDGALADCQHALQMRPDAANTMNTRGFVLFRQGRFADAVASYDASIRLDPNVASSYYVRGLARRALGEDAESDLAKAIEIEPGVRQRYAGYGINEP